MLNAVETSTDVVTVTASTTTSTVSGDSLPATFTASIPADTETITAGTQTVSVGSHLVTTRTTSGTMPLEEEPLFR